MLLGLLCGGGDDRHLHLLLMNSGSSDRCGFWCTDSVPARGRF